MNTGEQHQTLEFEGESHRFVRPSPDGEFG